MLIGDGVLTPSMSGLFNFLHPFHNSFIYIDHIHFNKLINGFLHAVLSAVGGISSLGKSTYMH